MGNIWLEEKASREWEKHVAEAMQALEDIHKALHEAQAVRNKVRRILKRKHIYLLTPAKSGK